MYPDSGVAVLGLVPGGANTAPGGSTSGNQSTAQQWLQYGQAIVHDLGGLFGSSSADKDRADRLNYIANAVLAGSVLAGRAILGGLTPNGIGAASERKAWQHEY